MFKRQTNFFQSRLLKHKYQHLINAQNIEHLSSFKVWRILKKESFQNKQWYLHHVLNQWFKDNNVVSIKFLNRLKRIIRKNKIILNELEHHNLNLLEERIFSRMRHIKVLNVNLKLFNKEISYVRFDLAQVYINNKVKLLQLLEGELLMTNRRFIIYNSTLNQTMSFFYRNIETFLFKHYGLEITTSKGTFLIRIHDQVTLNQTFKNLIEKKIRWLHKKILSFK